MSVRLTVLPDGRVVRVEVVGRQPGEVASEAAVTDVKSGEKVRAALDTEVDRVMKAMRFAPSSRATDTVTVASVFRIL